MTKEEAKEIVELYHGGIASGFYTKLLDALGHADSTNVINLHKGFPELVEACHEYSGSPDAS